MLKYGSYCFFFNDSKSASNEYYLGIKRVYDWTNIVASITNSYFESNNATENGGAVAISSNNGTYQGYLGLSITSSYFENNTAITGSGGGLYNFFGVDTLLDNAMSILEISNVDFEYNNAVYGGAIGIEMDENTTVWRTAVRIWNSSLDYNYASYSGGAMHINWGNVYLLSNAIRNNTAIYNGGGIYVYGAGFVSLSNSLIDNYASQDGAGIYRAYYSQYSPYTYCMGIYNTIFEDNIAGQEGGALWLGLYGKNALYGASCFKVYNDDFSQNNASEGGEDAYLAVTKGSHNILTSASFLTKLCKYATCKSIESVLTYMCVQEYSLITGICIIIEREKNNNTDYADNWKYYINQSYPTLELNPGASGLYQIFGWDAFGNQLSTEYWNVSLVGVDPVKLTTVIESPDKVSWIFPLFVSQSQTGEIGYGYIVDDNNVATNYSVKVNVTACSNGYERKNLSNVLFTCHECLSGTYTMTTTTCKACILGMDCRGGDNVSIDYQWSGIQGDEGDMLVARCPLGYCCNNYDGCDFSEKSSLCQTGRDSNIPLCGDCEAGLAETTSSKGVCKVCSNKDVWILIVPAFLGSIMISNFIRGGLRPIQNIPHPTMVYISKTLVWIFQLLPYLTFQSTSVLLLPLTNFLNFDINVGGSSSSGYCMLATLGPRKKLFFQLVPTGSYIIQFLIIFALFQVRLRNQPVEDQVKYNAAIKIAMWQVFLILYNKISGTLIKLADCRKIGGPYGLRMYYAGVVECYDTTLYICALCLLLCLIFPFVVWYALYKAKKQFGWVGVRKRYSFLVMPYRRSTYWYGAWNLLRGFLIIIISSLPTDSPDITATYLACTMGFILGIHVFAQPYYHDVNNGLETFALFCAFGITLFNIKLSAPESFSYIIGVLSILPLCPVALVLARFIYDKLPIKFQAISTAPIIQEGGVVDVSAAAAAASLASQPVLGSIFSIKLCSYQIHVIKKSLVSQLQENALSIAELELKQQEALQYKEDDSRSWHNSHSFGQEMREAKLAEMAALEALGDDDDDSSSYSITRSSNQKESDEDKDESEEKESEEKTDEFNRYSDNDDNDGDNDDDDGNGNNNGGNNNDNADYDNNRDHQQDKQKSSDNGQQRGNIEMQVLSSTINNNNNNNNNNVIVSTIQSNETQKSANNNLQINDRSNKNEIELTDRKNLFKSKKSVIDLLLEDDYEPGNNNSKINKDDNQKEDSIEISVDSSALTDKDIVREPQPFELLDENERNAIESNIMSNIFNGIFDIFEDITKTNEKQMDDNEPETQNNDDNKKQNLVDGDNRNTEIQTQLQPKPESQVQSQPQEQLQSQSKSKQSIGLPKVTVDESLSENKDDEVITFRKKPTADSKSIIDSEIRDAIEENIVLKRVMSPTTQELVSIYAQSLHGTDVPTILPQSLNDKKDNNNNNNNNGGDDEVIPIKPDNTSVVVDSKNNEEKDDNKDNNKDNQRVSQIKTHQAQMSSLGNLDLDNILETFHEDNNLDIVDENEDLEEKPPQKIPSNRNQSKQVSDSNENNDNDSPQSSPKPTKSSANNNDDSQTKKIHAVQQSDILDIVGEDEIANAVSDDIDVQDKEKNKKQTDDKDKKRDSNSADLNNFLDNVDIDEYL